MRVRGHRSIPSSPLSPFILSSCHPHPILIPHASRHLVAHQLAVVEMGAVSHARNFGGVRGHEERLAGVARQFGNSVSTVSPVVVGLPVGSSARMSNGSCDNARAMATRCSPPEKLVGMGGRRLPAGAVRAVPGRAIARRAVQLSGSVTFSSTVSVGMRLKN